MGPRRQGYDTATTVLWSAWMTGFLFFLWVHGCFTQFTSTIIIHFTYSPSSLLYNNMNHGYTYSILRTIGAIGLRAPNREEPVEISQQAGEWRFISGRRHVTFFFFFPDWGTLLCTPYFVWDIIPSRNNRAVELNWGIIMLLCLHTHTHTHTLLTLNIECNLHWYQPWQLNAPSNCHPPKRSEMPTGALQRYRTPSVLRKLQ